MIEGDMLGWVCFEVSCYSPVLQAHDIPFTPGTTYICICRRKLWKWQWQGNDTIKSDDDEKDKDNDDDVGDDDGFDGGVGWL